MAINQKYKKRTSTRALLASVIIMFLMMFSISSISCQLAAPAPAPTEPEPNLSDTWAADGVITAGEYPGEMDYEGYEIFWASDEQYIYFGMRAKTTGWVAVGFQPKPLHSETDMVLGFVKGGETSVFDMFSTGDLGPCTADTELGGTDDIIEFGGKEENGTTTIEFKRLLNTDDEYDGKLTKGANEIIWAYATLDDPRQKHIDQGRSEVNL